MCKRVRGAAVFFGGVLLVAGGCGKDPGEPSFPRAVAGRPTPVPTIPVVVPPVMREIRPNPNHEPLHVGGEVLAPVEIIRVMPDCRSLTGAVFPVSVELVVARDGTVSDARVLSAVPERAQGVVLQTVRGWRFRPATFNGQPVVVYYTVSLRCT